MAGSPWPRLFLGDRGFLARYGSQLGVEQIASLMKRARAAGIPGVSAGDEACVEAYLRMIAKEGPSPLFYHSPALLKLVRGGDAAAAMRCALKSAVEASGDLAKSLLNDPFVGPEFLGTNGVHLPGFAFPPVASDFVIDESQCELDASLILRSQPCLVSIGGDWLDTCLALGDWKTVVDTVERYAGVCKMANADLVVFSEFAPLFLSTPRVEALKTAGVRGWMLPFNLCGFGMVPDAASQQDWVTRRGLPFLAMHVLAMGQIPVEAALCSLFEHSSASSAVIGASTNDHIDSLGLAYYERYEA